MTLHGTILAEQGSNNLSCSVDLKAKRVIFDDALEETATSSGYDLDS